MRGGISTIMRWEDDPSFETVMQLRNYLDPNGNLHRTTRANEFSLNRHIRNNIMPELRIADGNADKRFDESRVGIENFRNLQSLIINCPPSRR
jgi:hypothetical protein